MNRNYATRTQLKDLAKDLLNGSYGCFILGMFLFALMEIALSVFTYLPIMILSLEPEPPSWLSIAEGASNILLMIFSGFLQFGFAFLSLKIVARQYRSFSDIFLGFSKPYFRNVLLLSLVRAIVNTLCFLPANYVMNHWLNPEDLPTVLYYLVALLVGYVIYIPLILPLDMGYFLMLDFPDLTGTALLAQSFSVMKGHVKRLFCLQCSFIPLQFLCMLSLGVGFLWLIPYMHMTCGLFYLDLLSPTNKQY